jgi:hypothetical protein
MQITVYQPFKRTDYISAKTAAKRLGITSRRLRLLAAEGRVVGAHFHEQLGWQFPKSGITVKPGKRGPAPSFSEKSFCNP